MTLKGLVRGTQTQTEVVCTFVSRAVLSIQADSPNRLLTIGIDVAFARRCNGRGMKKIFTDPVHPVHSRRIGTAEQTTSGSIDHTAMSSTSRWRDTASRRLGAYGGPRTFDAPLSTLTRSAAYSPMTTLLAPGEYAIWDYAHNHQNDQRSWNRMEAARSHVTTSSPAARATRSGPQSPLRAPH